MKEKQKLKNYTCFWHFYLAHFDIVTGTTILLVCIFSPKNLPHINFIQNYKYKLNVDVSHHI